MGGGESVGILTKSQGIFKLVLWLQLYLREETAFMRDDWQFSRGDSDSENGRVRIRIRREIRVEFSGELGRRGNYPETNYPTSGCNDHTWLSMSHRDTESMLHAFIYLCGYYRGHHNKSLKSGISKCYYSQTSHSLHYRVWTDKENLWLPSKSEIF